MWSSKSSSPRPERTAWSAARERAPASLPGTACARAPGARPSVRAPRPLRGSGARSRRGRPDRSRGPRGDARSARGWLAPARGVTAQRHRDDSAGPIPHRRARCDARSGRARGTPVLEGREGREAHGRGVGARARHGRALAQRVADESVAIASRRDGVKAHAPRGRARPRARAERRGSLRRPRRRDLRLGPRRFPRRDACPPRASAALVLSLPPTVRVLVAVEPIDMRGSFDALAGAVRRLRLDPVDGHLYLLMNKRRRIAKALSGSTAPAGASWPSAWRPEASSFRRWNPRILRCRSTARPSRRSWPASTSAPRARGGTGAFRAGSDRHRLASCDLVEA
jgi:hypothetical protein